MSLKRAVHPPQKWDCSSEKTTAELADKTLAQNPYDKTKEPQIDAPDDARYQQGSHTICNPSTPILNKIV